jgi:hypothetical protein
VKTLAAELVYQGRKLRQLQRHGKAAIYEASNKAGVLCGFEVIEIQTHPAQEIFGRTYPEREGYPDSESWGSKAWSFGAVQQKEALKAFEILAKEVSVSCADSSLDAPAVSI